MNSKIIISLLLFVFLCSPASATQIKLKCLQIVGSEKPSVFFSTTNEYTKMTTDSDSVDDTRDFTSEALYASSEKRLNRNLTKNELQDIIRTKEQFETLNYLFFR